MSVLVIAILAILYLMVGAIVVRITVFREIRNDTEAAGFIVWAIAWPLFIVLYAMITAGEKAVEMVEKLEERRKK